MVEVVEYRMNALSALLGLHQALAGHDGAVLCLFNEALLQHILNNLAGLCVSLCLLLGLLEFLLHALIVRQLLLDGLLLDHGLGLLVQDLLLGSAPLRAYLHEEAISAATL